MMMISSPIAILVLLLITSSSSYTLWRLPSSSSSLSSSLRLKPFYMVSSSSSSSSSSKFNDSIDVTSSGHDDDSIYDDDDNIVYIIPMDIPSSSSSSPSSSSSSSFTLRSVTSYLKKWATLSSSLGPAIRPTADTNTGSIVFTFTASPGTTLMVYAREVQGSSSGSGRSIVIASKLVVQGGSPQIQSLVRLAATDLLEGLSNDIGALIMTGHGDAADIVATDIAGADPTLPTSPPSPSPPSPPSQSSQKTTTTTTTSSSSSSSDQPFKMPTEKDIRGMWKEDAAYDPNDTKYRASSGSSGSTGSSTDSNGAKTISMIKTTVSSWDKMDNVDTAMILTTVKAWCDKYVGIGNGMAANDLADDGVRITFFLTDESELRIRLEEIPTDSTAGSSTSGKYYQLVSNLLLTSSISADDELIVSRATDRLLEKLKKEVDSYQFVRATSSSIGDSSSSSKSSGEKPYVDEDDVDEALDALRAAAAAFSSSSSSSTATTTAPKRDPVIASKAKDIGVKLENFEGRGLEEQAMKELNDMISNSKKSGFLATIKAAEATINTSTSTTTDTSGSGSSSGNETSIGSLFKEGATISEDALRKMLDRYDDDSDDLSKPQTKFPINLKAGGLAGGIDIFQDPVAYMETDATVLPAPESSYVGQLAKTAAKLTPPSPSSLTLDTTRLNMLVVELNRTDTDLHAMILDSYKDVLLCDNFLYMLRQANQTEYDTKTRLVYKQITDKATTLAAEVGALAKTESVRHLQLIHDICEVAAEYQDKEVQFLERMEYMKPRFDSEFASYLKFAIEEEELSIRNAGGDPVRLPSNWLNVLRIVRQGVIAEFETRFERLLDPLFLVLRFDQRECRADLFRRFVNITAPMDLQYMKEIATNMIEGTLQMKEEDIPDTTIISKLYDLKEDIDKYLSEDIVTAAMSSFDNDLKQQGMSYQIGHKNPVVRSQMETNEELREREERLGLSDSIIDNRKTQQ